MNANIGGSEGGRGIGNIWIPNATLEHAEERQTVKLIK